MNISVIIPVYNVKNYIRKCIDSVLNQTLSDLQIILVDDGSTDGSGKICDEYAEKDNRINVIHSINQGAGYARNSGLNVAQGKYIFFLDSDDWILPDGLRELYKTAETNSADLVCFDCFNVYDRNQKDFKQLEKQIRVVDNKVELFKLYFNSEISSATWSKLYKKTLWQGVRFPNIRIHEDAWIYHLILDKCNKAVITNQIYYAYYQSPNSIQRSSFKAINLKCLEVGNRYVEFTREKYPELVNYAYLDLVQRQLYTLDKMKHDMVVKQFRTEYKNIVKDLKTALPYIKSLDSKRISELLSRANSYIHPNISFFYRALKKCLFFNRT